MTDTPRPGPLALVGSGEFTPPMLPTDTALLADRAPRVAVVPTASSTEGDATVRRWLDLAHGHYAAIGVEVVEIDVRDRAGAHDPVHVAALADVGLVYLFGGRPDHLVEVLEGTPLLEAILGAWSGGAALAGCSAGAMALAAGWPPFLRAGGSWGTGLGALPEIGVVPHFDRFAGWRPRYPQRIAAEAPAGWRVLGIDEDTAVVHDEGSWRVEGVAGAWWLTPDGRVAFGEAAPPHTPGGATDGR
jgi:cyanophycinase